MPNNLDCISSNFVVQGEEDEEGNVNIGPRFGNTYDGRARYESIVGKKHAWWSSFMLILPYLQVRVGLIRPDNCHIMWVCDGVIISKDVVLTSARCIKLIG
jgi:hypothetical protein